MSRYLLSSLALPFLCAWTAPSRAVDNQSPMTFNDVREVAPGVFFRYSAISATDPGSVRRQQQHLDRVRRLCRGHRRQLPTRGREAVEAIKKTTDKPIRYVSTRTITAIMPMRNAVFAPPATVVAQTNCAVFTHRRSQGISRCRAVQAPQRRRGKQPQSSEPDLRRTKWFSMTANIVEFYFLGHAHTAGDASLISRKRRSFALATPA